MIITVDIGNTNIKFGIFKNDLLIAQFKQRMFNNATSDEIGLFIYQFFNNNNFIIKEVEDIIISSVVPQVMFSFIHAIKKYFYREPIIVGKNLNYDFSYICKENVYSAADRLVCCYYAYKKYHGPSVVIDFGTATTFDVISENGSYLGGAIYPGVRILSDVLTEKTAQLPRVEIQYPKKIYGVDTINQMQTGIIYGYIGAVKNITCELIRQFGLENNQSTNIIATGGLVSVFDEKENLFDIIDKTLILEGLNSLCNEHNKLKS